MLVQQKNALWLYDKKRQDKKLMTEEMFYQFAYYYAEHDKHKPLGRAMIERNGRQVDIAFARCSGDVASHFREAPEFSLKEFHEAFDDYEELSESGYDDPNVQWPVRFKGKYYIINISRRWENLDKGSD